jgi:hypothetical protein
VTGLAGSFQEYIHKHLLDYFSDIWFEAKNRANPFVMTIPMGLTPYYVINATAGAVTRIIADGHANPKKKQKLVMAGLSATHSLILKFTTAMILQYLLTYCCVLFLI